jgi:hypothetical protein
MTLDDDGNYLKYQNDGEKDDDFGNNAEEGPEGGVLVLDPDEADTFAAVVQVGHIVGDALEAPTISSGKQ